MIADLAFIGNTLNRQADERSDDMVKNLKSHRPLYIVLQNNTLFYREKIQTSRSSLPNIFLEENDLADFTINREEACYLGRLETRPIIAVPLKNIGGTEIVLPLGYQQITLRASFVDAVFTQEQSGILAQAAALLNWHQNHGFCSFCGFNCKNADGGAKRVCQNCKKEHFPRTDPVAIMLVHYQDQCLLARTAHFERGRYSCLAGFVESGETLEQAVRRESFEEMGVKIGAVTYLASQPWPFPYSLMFGCHAKALTEKITIDYREMEDGRWFKRDEIIKMINNSHELSITLPPKGTIARYLIEAWVKGEF